MQKFNLKNRNARTILIGIFVLFAFAQYGFANTWQQPTAQPPGNNVFAPLNTSVDSQTKGMANSDSTALAPDPSTTLTLKSGGGSTAGLFTEGLLSSGGVPTLGYISASLAPITGLNPNSRSPLFLAAGLQAPLVNIVLSNVNGTNTKRLGVWSEKDGGWANTRIMNAYFDKLLIGGGDDMHKMTYTQAGITYTNPGSYTHRFMGFLFNNNYGYGGAPSHLDPEYNLGVNQTPSTISNCNVSSTVSGVGSYNGTHRYCVFNNNFVYEMVPPTTLDIAGVTEIGNGGTCVIRNTDECPLGSYLQKVGTYRNNICKAFTGSCTAPNAPYTTLDESTTYGAGYDGASDVAWLKAEKIQSAQTWVDIVMAQDCSAANMQNVASNGVSYFFPNLGKQTTLQLSTINNIVLYEKNSMMLDNPTSGFYRVLYHPNNPRHASWTANNSAQYIIQLGEAGDVLEVNAC